MDTMDTKEIFSHIRHIEIKTGKLVNEIFAGQYNSVFKGRGMEFAEVREYQIGDDIRSIDWNVTARTGHPYVKQYVEERELTVILVVDMSASLKFGTYNKYKMNIAAELASILAFSAIKNNDKVGMLIFTDKIEKFILPKKGRQHILRMIREILYFKPQNSRTNLKIALEYLNEVIKRKAVVFLFSDFDSGGYEKSLKITSRKHDVINVIIKDPRESEIPRIGFVQFKDNETGEIIEINTSKESFQKFMQKRTMEKDQELKKLFTKSGLDYLEIFTNKSYVEPLIKFFKNREKRIFT
ncbi:DUF58 domain-containing protein [bacterium]